MAEQSRPQQIVFLEVLMINFRAYFTIVYLSYSADGTFGIFGSKHGELRMRKNS